MKHIIKLNQSDKWYDIKYRRKWYRFRTMQEAISKANGILITLFFSGVPMNNIIIQNNFKND